MAGVQKKFDAFGVLTLGFVTAVGGGTLRDVLIGSTLVDCMQDENYIYLIFSAVLVCYFFKNFILNLKKGLFLFDTIGIGLFTILGMQKTLDIGLSPLTAVMMGIVSAVFGGIIRDVLFNEVPLIFRKEIYASACLVGALIFLGSKQVVQEEIAMLISISSVIK